MHQLSYLLEMSPGSILWCCENKIHKQTVKKVTSCFLLPLFCKTDFWPTYITLRQVVACRYAHMGYPGVSHQQQPACLAASGDPGSHDRNIALILKCPSAKYFFFLLKYWLMSWLSWNLSQSHRWQWLITDVLDMDLDPTWVPASSLSLL